MKLKEEKALYELILRITEYQKGFLKYNMEEVIKKWSSNKAEVLNVGVSIRNTYALQRLQYLNDRLKDLYFITEYFNKNISFKSKKYKEEFIKLTLLIKVPHILITIYKSLLNFISYFYDLETKDEQLNEEGVINYLSLKNNYIAEQLRRFITSKNIKDLKALVLQEENAYLLMDKIITSKEGERRSLQVLKNYDNFEENISRISDFFIKDLKEFMDIFINKTSDPNNKNIGYSSVNDLTIQENMSSKNFIGVIPKDIKIKEKIVYIKIYNLKLDLIKVLTYPRFAIYQNISYREDSEKMYRDSTKVSKTVQLSTGTPTSIKKEIFPPIEGEMLWTHTLVLKKNKFENIQTIVKEITLILSLFNENTVYSKYSYLHNSHKTSCYRALDQRDYEANLNLAINNLHKKEGKKRKMILGLLSEYANAKQPDSLPNIFTKLWGIIDKLSTFYEKKKTNIQEDSDERKIINQVEKIINSNDKLKNSNLSETLHREYSLRQDYKNYFYKQLKIHKILGLPFSQIWKVIDALYKRRSNLIHTADQYINPLDKSFIYDYLFISNLVFLALCHELGIEPKYTLDIIKGELKGFITDKDYYPKKHKEEKAREKHIDEVLEVMSGKKKLKPGESISF